MTYEVCEKMQNEETTTKRSYYEYSRLSKLTYGGEASSSEKDVFSSKEELFCT